MRVWRSTAMIGWASCFFYPKGYEEEGLRTKEVLSEVGKLAYPTKIAPLLDFAGPTKSEPPLKRAQTQATIYIYQVQRLSLCEWRGRPFKTVKGGVKLACSVRTVPLSDLRDRRSRNRPQTNTKPGNI